ncbi:MAG: hypothetical protein BMS9Abin08_1305 [Gammaproteobacteria bacterium]|nr:MAG: hypothetical protein BMS9Abin08_1305 [Gammaproteobacteria bacterium]
MRNPVIQFLLWGAFLSYPTYAQEAIQIEIDSAPVEVEIQKPADRETTGQQTAEAPEPAEPEEQTAESGAGGGQTVAIAVGAVVAAGLALLAGGGGGSGGSNSTPSH